MADNGNKSGNGLRLKVGLAEMLKGGVIMDVVNAEHARIAEDAGAVAVMALERVPSDIRRDGGVARMSDPAMNDRISGSIPNTLVRTLMRIGRTRVLTDSRMASRGSIDSARMWFRDWWTIRIALLTTVPTRMMKPSMVRTSRGW